MNVTLPSETLLAEMEKSDEQTVMATLLTGKPVPPEVAERVHERAKRIRERTFLKHGLLDIAVPAIRELRGELP